MFRELLQNADDAEATEAQIEFQTIDYAKHSAGESCKASENDGTIPDLLTIKVSFGVVLSSKLALKHLNSCPNGLFAITASASKNKIGNGWR